MAEHHPWNGDQADGLRRLFGTRAPQVVAVVSGREACGKTTLTVQTAAALAGLGHGVVIVDENPGPDNALAAFGLAASHDLLHVVKGQRSLAHVVKEAAPSVRILPAARAARELVADELSTGGRSRLSSSWREVQRGADFVLIDCANRRGGQLSALAALARHLVVVVAAQGAAITHSYALIKRIAQEHGRDGFQIAITRARSGEEARAIFNNMRRVAGEYLGVRLDYLGAAAVPVTDHLADAMLSRLPPAVDAADPSSGMRGFAPTKSGLAVLDSVL